ncbi:MAG: lipid-A-disaccharide synthase, partial [Desulfobacteraceae bacterium]
MSLRNKLKSKHIMVLAGEPSGDLHGARLLKEIRDRESQIRVTGIGGDRMTAAGMEIFFHIDRLSVMGLTEVLRQAGAIKKAFGRFKQKIRTDRPNLLVLIDYPGFNLKAAAFAHRHKIPVLYYITPKVWAWKPSRLKQIKENVDHAALIFPFEEKLFNKKQIPCTFVGHPLLDGCDDEIIRKTRKKRNERFTIGLLPGSRESEISALLETMLKAAELIAARTDNIRVLISQSLSVQEENFRNIVGQYNENNLFTIVKGDVQQLFEEVDFL